MICERTEFVPGSYDFCNFNINPSVQNMVLIFPSQSYFVLFFFKNKNNVQYVKE